MADPLVEQSDVEAVLLRSLTDTEELFIDALCQQASALLRVLRRNIDDRIEGWNPPNSTSNAVDPDAVSAMLATVVKRAIVNPRGLWSTSETAGDYSYTETYPGQRAGASGGTPGEVAIGSADLAKIDGTSFTYRSPFLTRPGWLT